MSSNEINPPVETSGSDHKITFVFIFYMIGPIGKGAFPQPTVPTNHQGTTELTLREQLSRTTAKSIDP
jgi:hypothetical protein